MVLQHTGLPQCKALAPWSHRDGEWKKRRGGRKEAPLKLSGLVRIDHNGIFYDLAEVRNTMDWLLLALTHDLLLTT